MSCKVKRLSRKPALKGGNSLPKQFEHNPNIRSNLLISSSPRNQTSTKRSRTIFLKIGLICFRIPSRQSTNFSEFCKVFFSNRFCNMIAPLNRYQLHHQARRSSSPPSPTHAFLTRQICTNPSPGS